MKYLYMSNQTEQAVAWRIVSVFNGMCTECDHMSDNLIKIMYTVFINVKISGSSI